MQDEVNTKVVAIAIKGGRITAEVLKKALAKFIEEIEKAEKQASQPKTYRGKQSIKHLKVRPYRTSNLYAAIQQEIKEKEELQIAQQHEKGRRT